MSAAFGGLVSLLLLAAPGNRIANRLLAALLGTAVLQLVPYVIGYAGFYDAYPWLSFAPFDFGLASGPLLYFYVRRLTKGPLPSGWWRHFAPAALYFVYTVWAFSLPLAAKNRWDNLIHARWIDPAVTVATIVSLAVYLGAAIGFRRGYLRWLAKHVSDKDVHRQPWLFTVLTALGVWLLVTSAFESVDHWVVHLNYFDRFPQYLLFSAIILWLGLEGWRHAGHRFPLMQLEQPAVRASVKDWPLTAAKWRDQIRVAGWWREPGLTLTDVARRLATNESYVSRAFNKGLGRNFNAVINAIRVEAVQTKLMENEGPARGAGELILIALEAGFSSKASFNRVFREQTGVTPSAWRASHCLKDRAIP